MQFALADLQKLFPYRKTYKNDYILSVVVLNLNVKINLGNL